MRQKTSMVICAVLISMAIAGTAFAWGDRGPCSKGGRHNKGKMEAMTKELNLTADQQARLKEVKEAKRAQLKDLRLALKEKRRALKDELSKSGVTRQAVEPLVAEIKGLEAGLTEQRVDGIFKIKEILTPEQFAKLQAKKDGKYKGGKMKHCRKGR